MALLVITAILVALGLWLLSRPHAIPPPHVDSAGLRQFINIDIPITAVKWEIFKAPEDGFLPTPDPYTTLIAEIELSDPGWYQPQGMLTTRGQVRPESVRPWLSPLFKDLMHKATTDGHALAAFKCEKLVTPIKSSGRVVQGFMCASSGKVLLHLLVDGPPAS